MSPEASGRIDPVECIKIIEENFDTYYETGQYTNLTFGYYFTIIITKKTEKFLPARLLSGDSTRTSLFYKKTS